MNTYIIGGQLGGHLDYLKTLEDAKMVLFRLGFSTPKLVRLSKKNFLHTPIQLFPLTNKSNR